MTKIFDYITAHSIWLVPCVALPGAVVWFAVESRWASYIRKKNYQELKILGDLREKSIITQEEFDERKEQLLSAC